MVFPGSIAYRLVGGQFTTEMGRAMKPLSDRVDAKLFGLDLDSVVEPDLGAQRLAP